MRTQHHAENGAEVTNGNGDKKRGLSMLERIDLALASRFVTDRTEEDMLAAAQRVVDGVRRPTPEDPLFAASVLRLRGFVLDDDDAVAVFAGRGSRLSPVTQEYRMLRGLQRCLGLLRKRAADGTPPDGWFLVELFRELTADLPRFRNNELRRSAPWDALLYVSYPAADELPSLLDTFDEKRCFRDAPVLFHRFHPVRQAFRLMWRFARLAPFPDFNVPMAWLGMNAWLQAKGFPLLTADLGDQSLMVRLLSGPPPQRIVQLEARLLSAFGAAA